MNASRGHVVDSLAIVWAIATKDIVDSLRNKLIVSLILGMAFMLLMPLALGVMLVPPQMPLLVTDIGNTRLTTLLDSSDQYQVQRVGSAAEVEQIVGSVRFGLGAQFGLAIPGDFDQRLNSGEELEIDGYVAWANRRKASALRDELEAQIELLVGQPVQISMEGNLVYPSSDSGLWLLMVTLTPVAVIFMMGISLVPALLFEEKQTKTMAALLVAPASISQVIIGKALAGLFYLVVAAGVLFVINWTGVVHWQIVPLFVLGIGLSSTAVGLLLGSFFERQQDVAGLTMVLTVLFIGALFVNMLGMEIPAVVQALLPWIPSVALARIIQFVFLEHTPWGEIWLNMGRVLSIAALCYAAVVWKVRQSDR